MDYSAPEVVMAGVSGIVGGLVGLLGANLARIQSRTAAATIAADWFRDLRDWASEAIDVVTEAAYSLSDGCSISDPRIHVCCHRLSSLIDRGRLLLPNEKHEQYGTHKSRAFQGYRHPALDALVAAIRILRADAELESFPDRSTALTYVRKEFVTTIQFILDPEKMNKSIATYLGDARRSREDDPTFGGLLPHPEKVPRGATRLLHLASLHYLADEKRDKPRPSPR